MKVKRGRNSVSERRLIGIFTAHLLGLTILAVLIIGSLPVDLRSIVQPSLIVRMLLPIIWSVWTITGLCALAVFPRWRKRLLWLGLWGAMVMSTWVVGLSLMEIVFNQFILDGLFAAVLPSAVCAAMAFGWTGLLGQRWNLQGRPTPQRQFAFRTLIVVVTLISLVAAWSRMSDSVRQLLATQLVRDGGMHVSGVHHHRVEPVGLAIQPGFCGAIQSSRSAFGAGFGVICCGAIGGCCECGGS